jgi:phage terminase large subunit-like protein
MIAARHSVLHPVTQYAVDVVDGRIVASQEVIWSCRQHLEDLEHGDQRGGFWFDEGAADGVFLFFRQIRLVEGEFAGEPFELQPWQKYAIGSVFGWMRDDGYRRFSEAWIRVARGNGKSPMAAGVGLYCTGWDGAFGADGQFRPEQRAQVFAVATKLDQAAIVHGVARLMVERSPYLAERLRVPKTFTGRTVKCRIIHPETASFFQPIGRDSGTEDGHNPLAAIFDEVHAYADGGMWDVFKSAMVKRRQHLLFGITTSGYGGPGTFGIQQDQYYRSLIDPKSGVRNDSAFVYIAQIAPEERCSACQGKGRAGGALCQECGGRGAFGDDFRDEKVWPKANPNIGVSVYVDGLRKLVKEALINKRREPDVKVKNMNLWQQGGSRAISLRAWDACGHKCPVPSLEELKRRPCFAGGDLASNRDLNALVLYFPICGPWDVAVVLSFFWIAEETIKARLQEDRIDYQPWVDAEEILTTPGEFTDQDAIRRKLNELAKVYTIKKIGWDRKFGEKLLPELDKDGFEVVRIAQSFANLCPAWQKLEQMIGKKQLAHGGHRVLRWNAGNVVLAYDLDRLEMPSKGKSSEKIDGIAALLNAIHLAMTTPYEAPPAPPVSHALPKGRGGGRRAILGAFR